MVRCEYKFALGFWALCFFAAVNAFAVPIEPFYFENAVDQEATWDDLMKYKLWGTGHDTTIMENGQQVSITYGVWFSNNKVFITDSLGYSGSARGSLVFANEAHSIGGPLAFGGGFKNGTGQDTIMTGPSRFGGTISIEQNAYNSRNVVWRGPVCAKAYERFDRVGANQTCSDTLLPAIDSDLDVPKVKTGFTYNLVKDSYLFQNKTDYIDIPEGEGFYNIHVTGNVTMKSNNDTLYIRMPEGRFVRIFIDGQFDISMDLHNILVMTITGGSWNESAQRWEGGTQQVVENKDYAGNVLFYSPNDIIFPSEKCTMQGTYISGGTIKFLDHYRFAGQLLAAKKVQIHHDFDAGDFRYVPFFPAKLKVDKKLREDHEDIGDTVRLYLSLEPSTRVPFRYCYEFLDDGAENTAGSKYAHRQDVVDANLPLCANGDTVRAHFEKGHTTLTNPIILHAKYDALAEKEERFYIRVCDLEAAVYADGDRTEKCARLPIDIINVPKSPLSADFTVIGFMNDPLVIDSFPALNPDSSLLKDYSVRIEKLVSVGTLTLDGTPVKVGDIIHVNNLSKLVFKGKTDEFGAPYDSLRYSIIRNSDNTISDDTYQLAINLVSAMFPVLENSKKDEPVGYVETDMTSPTFSILDATNTFVIDPASGLIKVAKDSTIDYEVKNSYEVGVSIKSGDVVKNVLVQILVIDVNDPPSIEDTTMSVRENEPVGTEVGVLAYYDQDGPNSGFRQNKFSLIGGDSSLFAIDATSGVITTREVFDYEALPADKKYYTVKVQIIDNDGYKSLADVRINIVNVVENSVIVVTHAESGNGSFDKANPELPIKVNDKTVTLSWTGDGIPQPDTTLKKLHEGNNVVRLTYYDKTKDGPAILDVTIFVCTKTPEVELSTKVDEIVPDNIYTVVEQPAEGDTSFYVNKKKNDILISLKEPVLDSTYTDSTCNYKTRDIKVSAVPFDTLKVSQSTLNTMKKISSEKIMLNDMPSSKVTKSPFNDSLVLVSYTDKVGGEKVTVSYVTNAKGDLHDGLIKVSYETKIDGKTVTVSYKADALTGEPVESESGALYMVAYDYTDKNDVTVSVGYSIDSKGHVVKDVDKNVIYEVNYTYVNEFGNTASRSIAIVIDLIAPEVKILSPHTDDVLFSNYVDVKWTVDQKDGRGAQVMDTLKVQGLNKGGNTIIRYYRDKAGNVDGDTVYVIMKDAKDVDISVVKPVTLVTRDKTEEYYASNEPEKGQKFAVTIYNSKTGKEVETLRGGDFKTKKGSGDEPYPGYSGHLGPTLAVDTKLPVMSAVGGLATLDDLVGKDGLVSLDGLESTNGTKATVEDYVREHCTAEFQGSLGTDISRASLFHTTMKVKIWVYTTIGNFVDYFTFDQVLDDPDYTNDAGVMTLYFEQKPDKDGYVRTANGRLYATGAYLYKTEVTMKSELQCDLPPVKGAEEANKMGAIRKVSEDLLKPFGYKRPENK